MQTPALLHPVISRPPHLHVRLPSRAVLPRHARALINAPIQSTRPLAAFSCRHTGRLGRLSPIPLSIHKQIVQPKAQQRKFITFQILWIIRAKIYCSRNAAHDRNLVRINQCPRRREPGVFPALEEQQPRNDEKVVREGVAELMPPVFADDLARVDLIDAPKFRVPAFVEEDGLEDVALKWDALGELGLVVRTVEAHFELGFVGGVHFDVVHRSEGLFGHFNTGGLINAGQGCDSLLLVVEVFVVAFHVVTVGVGDGNVV